MLFCLSGCGAQQQETSDRETQVSKDSHLNPGPHEVEPPPRLPPANDRRSTAASNQSKERPVQTAETSLDNSRQRVEAPNPYENIPIDPARVPNMRDSYLEPKERLPMGPQGPKGAQGPTGPRGPSGFDGRDGIDGIDGKDGIDGEDGEFPIAKALYIVLSFFLISLLLLYGIYLKLKYRTIKVSRKLSMTWKQMN